MSPDKVLAIYLTDTEAVDKLVISTLFFSTPLELNFQYQVVFTEGHRWFTFVQLLYLLLKVLIPPFPQSLNTYLEKVSTMRWI